MRGNFESIPLPDPEEDSNYNGPLRPAWPWKYLLLIFFFCDWTHKLATAGLWVQPVFAAAGVATVMISTIISA
jgi:hypothetical protein